VLALFPDVAVPLQVFVPLDPLAPVTEAEPAVIAHRRNVTFCDAYTTTAWLEAPAVVAGTESNSKSSNVTPFVSPSTCSANPAAVGASFVVVPAVYVQVAQSNPPYTEVPSRVVPDTTSCSPVNVPQAYTRALVSIACPIEPKGCSLLPSPVVSFPVGDTNAPNPSVTTHGSTEGSSVFARQSVLQPAPAG
jgi:hypothetical protein